MGAEQCHQCYGNQQVGYGSFFTLEVFNVPPISWTVQQVLFLCVQVLEGSGDSINCSSSSIH